MGKSTTKSLFNEVWKDIAGYEGFYQVSNTGKVKSVQRVMNVAVSKRHKRGLMTVNERILKGRPDCKGYLRVVLYIVMNRKQFKIHHLVLNAFKGKRTVSMNQCRHLDGDNNNNHIDNLEWGTSAENASDKIKHGRCVGNKNLYGDNATNRKLSSNDVIEIRKMLLLKEPYKRIADIYNVSSGAIHKINTNKTWNKV